MTARRGRPESEIDPEEGPVARFALALRKLRESAGSPPYRVMAKLPDVNYSDSILSKTADGKKAPKWRHVQAFVVACLGPDCDDELEEWRRRWQTLPHQSKPSGRNRLRADTAVVVLADRWLRRLLAMLGVSSVSAAVIFVVVVGIAPPVAPGELAGGCASGPMGDALVQALRGLKGGSRYDDEYQMWQRQAERLKQVRCVVDLDELLPPSASITEDIVG